LHLRAALRLFAGLPLGLGSCFCGLAGLPLGFFARPPLFGFKCEALGFFACALFGLVARQPLGRGARFGLFPRLAFGGNLFLGFSACFPFVFLAQATVFDRLLPLRLFLCPPFLGLPLSPLFGVARDPFGFFPRAAFDHNLPFGFLTGAALGFLAEAAFRLGLGAHPRFDVARQALRLLARGTLGFSVRRFFLSAALGRFARLTFRLPRCALRFPALRRLAGPPLGIVTALALDASFLARPLLDFTRPRLGLTRAALGILRGTRRRFLGGELGAELCGTRLGQGDFDRFTIGTQAIQIRPQRVECRRIGFGFGLRRLRDLERRPVERVGRQRIDFRI